MHFSPLTGLIAAPFSPMYEDGSLNIEIIPQYYEFLKHNQIAGAFICGSTGEGVSMSLEEKKQTAKAWANAGNGDKNFKIMLFLGGTNLSDCKELARYAKQIGLHAVSFTAPFYFKPTDIKVLANCCRTIADEVPDIPFYYYHIPSLNGYSEAMINLLEEVDGNIPNFAGIKYTHEDFMDFLLCMKFREGKYDMLWGRDENLLPALALGARGAVGSTFNYAAPLYHDLIGAFGNNEIAKARKLQHQSIEMIRLLGKYGGIGTGKAYMKLVGLNCGKFRLPVENMSDTQFELFKKDVEKLNFSSFSSLNAER